jgi:Caspase domain
VFVPNRQDAIEDGQATGAMSWAFIRALTKESQQSYLQLLNSIRKELEKKYTQKPQLSCSHPLGESYVTSHLLPPFNTGVRVAANELLLTDINLLFVM